MYIKSIMCIKYTIHTIFYVDILYIMFSIQCVLFLSCVDINIPTSWRRHFLNLVLTFLFVCFGLPETLSLCISGSSGTLFVDQVCLELRSTYPNLWMLRGRLTPAGQADLFWLEHTEACCLKSEKTGCLLLLCGDTLEAF